MTHEISPVPEEREPAQAEELLKLYYAGQKMMLALGIEPHRRIHAPYTMARKYKDRPHSYDALFSTFDIYQKAPGAGSILNMLGIGPQYEEFSMSFTSERASHPYTYDLHGHADEWGGEYWKYPVRDDKAKPFSHIYLFPGNGPHITQDQRTASLSFSATQLAIDEGKEPGMVARRWDTDILIENGHKITSDMHVTNGTHSPLTQVQCMALTSLVEILAKHPETLDQTEY